LRSGRQLALGISHLPHLGRQLSQYGLHTGLPGDRQASIDKDVAPNLIDEGARTGQQRPDPAVADEYRGRPAALRAIASAWRA
jgi:hypothetical protein